MQIVWNSLLQIESHEVPSWPKCWMPKTKRKQIYHEGVLVRCSNKTTFDIVFSFVFRLNKNKILAITLEMLLSGRFKCSTVWHQKKIIFKDLDLIKLRLFEIKSQFDTCKMILRHLKLYLFKLCSFIFSMVHDIFTVNAIFCFIFMETEAMYPWCI